MFDENDADRLLTPAEAARRLGICARTLRKHSDEGAIRYINVGAGKIREKRMFDPSDLAEFIDRNRKTGGPAVRTFGAARRRSNSAHSAWPAIDFVALRKARLASYKKKK